MKFFNSISFDILNKAQSDLSEHKLANMSDEAQIEAYGVGAAMPADILGFAFSADNRTTIHLA